MSTFEPYGEVNPITLAAAKGMPERQCYDFYSNSGERRSTESKDIFLRDALMNKDQLLYWAQMAYQIFKSNSKSYWDHAGNGWDKDFGDGHYFDMIEYLCREHGMSGGDDKCVSSGLMLTTSLNEVEQAAGKMAENLIGRKLKAGSFINRATIEPFHEKKDKQTVFYSIAGNRDRYGKTFQFGYTVLGLAFYNFRLKVVADGTAYHTAIGELSMEEAVSQGYVDKKRGCFSYQDSGTGETVVYPVCNDSREEITQSVSMSIVQSETEENTITNAKEYGFSEMIGTSFMLKDLLKISETTMEMQFTAEQVISTAYEETKSVSKEKEESSSVSVILPPHTALAVTQKDSNTVMTLGYDCPVMVQFDVAVFSMCGTCYDDNAAVHTFSTAGYDQRSFVTLFAASEAGNAGEDGSENLYLRSIQYEQVPGYEKSHGRTQGKSHEDGIICDELNWKTILGQSEAVTHYKRTGEEMPVATMKPTDLVLQLATKRPMSPTGGVLTESGRSISTTVDSAVALYPLAYLTLSNAALEYHMGVGDRMYPSNWSINGYNEKHVLFYGFDSKEGEWVLVDENGRELQDDTIAGIGKEPLTGMVFIQGNKEGVVYAKYRIRDNYYVWRGEKAITNDTIHTVFVKIIVHPQELQGSIIAEGSVNCTAGEGLVNLETVTTLNAIVYDEKEREITVPVLWEAQEAGNKGIQIINNQMSVSKPGTFHIRAVYERLCSNWVEVHAMADRGFSYWNANKYGKYKKESQYPV